MDSDTPPSFSAARKWTISLNVLLATLAVAALVVMTNYLAARHFTRLAWAQAARTELSPLTRRVLETLTNEIKITLYYEKDEPLYDMTWALLKEYSFANPRLTVDVVHYEHDPAAAATTKARYQLVTDKNLIIFDGQGKKKIVYQSELSDVDYSQLLQGQREVRRTHFKGELLFTSAILSVSNPRQLKAYALQGHGEPSLESEEKQTGFSKFAGVLTENNILYAPLELVGAQDIPADCNLLLILGALHPLRSDELDKIDRYLKQGGRLLALFNYYTLAKSTKLEELMLNWGVYVGHNVVQDKKFSANGSGEDIVVSQFGTHPLARPFGTARSRLQIFLPRSITPAESGKLPAGAAQVDVLATTSPEGRVISDIRTDGSSGPRWVPAPNDPVGPIPLAVAVEKGGIRGVAEGRGSTRLVVAGDSIFLSNLAIDALANHEFASHAVNWLLARNELIGNLGPRPIKEYKLILDQSQLRAARWILILGLPGAVLAVGFLVWVRRRN